MTQILWANNATTTIAGPITGVATSVTLQTGAGALFPAPGAGQYFNATLVDAATGLVREIVHVTTVAGDTCTIVRGQEGTTAVAWLAGDIFANLVTAGTMAAFAQTTGFAAGAPFVVDSGAANAYVVAPSPTPSSYTNGYTLRVQITHANTGASTINVSGLGAKALRRLDGTVLQSGDLPINCICQMSFDAGDNYFQLVAVNINIPAATTSVPGISALATLPQVVAGADATHVVTPSVLPTALGDTGAGGTRGFVPAAGAGTAALQEVLRADMTFARARYQSAPQAVAIAVSQPHSLGAHPWAFTAHLICVNAEFGYSAGDEVNAPSTAYTQGGGGTGAWGAQWADATNVGYSASDVTRISIEQKGGGLMTVPNANGYITAANWNIVLRAEL
jgi:hypothetical protein